jgi:hypothetical protein
MINLTVLSQAMIRMIPLFVSGATCNVVFAFVVGHISGAILLSVGCAATGCGCLLFALIKPAVTWWAFGFPATVVVVFGADL